MALQALVIALRMSNDRRLRKPGSVAIQADRFSPLDIVGDQGWGALIGARQFLAVLPGDHLLSTRATA
ncbi:hypothetical protein [Candidatus Methylomirabilis sp.]|uniref:hypothetical protein n=1 Tax=Candidatus Methylomirabilis sp. TaxID=2032687 RepID=UPI002A6010B3|nr:hypothetical protein [Candidatus Methylomirabilis sp.]